MNVQAQIQTYLASHNEAKQKDLQALHNIILQLLPKGKLWFLDGKNSDGKTVANPNIGYGGYTIKYADGTTRAFYQIGLSANKTGISVYILGIADKTFLAQTYGEKIGKVVYHNRFRQCSCLLEFRNGLNCSQHGNIANAGSRTQIVVSHEVTSPQLDASRCQC